MHTKIAISIALAILFSACGNGVIGTSEPPSAPTKESEPDDEWINPNPDQLLLSDWSDNPRYETDADGLHYIAIEKGGEEKVVASLLVHGDERDIPAVEWSIKGDLKSLIVKQSDRFVTIAAIGDRMDADNLVTDPEPSVLVTAGYGDLRATIRVVSVVNIAGTWEFHTRAGTFRMEVDQMGRTVFSDTPGFYGEVTKGGVFLELDGMPGAFALIIGRDELSGTYRGRDGARIPFVARRVDP